MSATKVRLLYTVVFMDLFACSLYIPILSGHLRSLGASHLTIGILSSLYAGLQLISSPIIGSWSDIRGRCFILELTLLCCCFLYVILGTTTAISIIVLCRVGLGMTKHTQTLCRTILTDIVPSSEQLALQGRLVSYGAVGFILGPAIGGHMAELDGGFRYVCYFVMLLFFTNFAIVYFFLSSTSHNYEKINENRDSTSADDAMTRVQKLSEELKNIPNAFTDKNSDDTADGSSMASKDEGITLRTSKNVNISSHSSLEDKDRNIPDQGNKDSWIDSTLADSYSNVKNRSSLIDSDMENLNCSTLDKSKGISKYSPPSDINRDIKSHSSSDGTIGDVSNESSSMQLRKSSIQSDIFLVMKHLSEVNWPIYWDIFALKFLLGFTQAVHYQNFAVILQEVYSITPKWVGYIISLQALVGAATGFGTGWISKFYKNDENNFYRTLHGFGVLMLTFIFLCFAPSLTFVILCLVPQSAAGSLLRITTSEVIFQRTVPSQRGSLVGSGQSMSSIARFVAPLCSGLVYDTFGFKGLSALKIVLPGAAMVLTAFCFQQPKHDKED